MAHSVHKKTDTMAIRFVLTDYHHHIEIKYNGLLPSLFREGQGIVAEGHLSGRHVFIADQLLAKHDASYHPPGIGNKPKRDHLIAMAQH